MRLLQRVTPCRGADAAAAAATAATTLIPSRRQRLLLRCALCRRQQQQLQQLQQQLHQPPQRQPSNWPSHTHQQLFAVRRTASFGADAVAARSRDPQQHQLRHQLPQQQLQQQQLQQQQQFQLPQRQQQHHHLLSEAAFPFAAYASCWCQHQSAPPLQHVRLQRVPWEQQPMQQKQQQDLLPLHHLQLQHQGLQQQQQQLSMWHQDLHIDDAERQQSSPSPSMQQLQHLLQQQQQQQQPWLEEDVVENFLMEPQLPSQPVWQQQHQQQALQPIDPTPARAQAAKTSPAAATAAAADETPEEHPSALDGLRELRRMGEAEQLQVYARLLGKTDAKIQLTAAAETAAAETAAAAAPAAEPGAPAAATTEGLSASVLLCLHALELEAMQHGLLLADVPKEELFRHITTAELPGETVALQQQQQQQQQPLLLSQEWLQQQKEAAYGSNPYPIPLRWIQHEIPDMHHRQQHQQEHQPHQQHQQQHQQQDVLQPSRSSVDEALCLLRRRQVIIEGCIWRRLTAEVQQQLQLLAAAGKGSDSGPAKRMWVPWVKDMAKPIAALQQQQGRFARPAAEVIFNESDAAAVAAAAVAAERECEDTLLPQHLEPVLLAVIAARTVLQQLLLPKATAPTFYTNRARDSGSSSSPSAGAAAAVAAAGGFEKAPDLQQRQALVTQLAMAIGDAVHAEATATFLEGLQQQQQQQLGQCYLPLRKQQQHQKKRNSSLVAAAAASGPVLVPRWSARRRLAVGGLLLQLLLRHAMIEAPYALAKEELAAELQHHRAEQQRILLSRRRKQEQQQQQHQEQQGGIMLNAAAAAAEATAEQIVASREAAAVEAATVAAEKAAAAAETAGDAAAHTGVYVPKSGRTADELHHLVAYKSQHGHDKVELPAFRHRVIYCSKRKKKFGVIEMRRLCFDRLTAVGGTADDAAATAAAAARAVAGGPSAAAAAAGAAAADTPPADLSHGEAWGSSNSVAASAAAVAASATATVAAAADRLSSPFWLMLKHVPMLLPPVPWTSYGSGGYLMLRTAFVRSVSDTDPSTSTSKSKSKGNSAAKAAETVDSPEKTREARAASEAPASEATAAGNTKINSTSKSSTEKAKARNGRSSNSSKRPEIYLGWGPRAKACQDFRVYDTAAVRSAVSFLGTVPWQINLEMLSLMQQAWASGDAMGKIPPRREIPVSELLQQHEQQQQEGSSSSSRESRSVLLRHLLQQETRTKSERPSFLLKLQTAENFASASAIYFPHNIDFRGRCYPLPPHLNHMGDDVSRSLLRFARGAPLGHNGWKWLRIHLANLFGKNKIAFEARCAWADERMQQIVAAAQQPFEHKAFWLAADDPWQALAAIKETAAAVASGDPRSYFSKLPIHMDGSCNGLQHYAALGRDLRGGAAVNLVPAETPQDVYSLVLQVVLKTVRRIARSGELAEAAAAELQQQQRLGKDTSKGKKGSNPQQQQHQQLRRQELARLCEAHGVLQRPVVKQTVMTVCYGVTALGARDQVLSQLEDLLGGRVCPETLREMGGFLARIVLQSIGEVFKRAMQTKKWLDSVSGVCAAAGVPVAWEVPVLGLFCEQPYRSLQHQQVRSALQRHTLHVAGDSAPVSRSKQRLGFPPNFIHSMDAAHMMLTAADCIGRHKIDMAAVHDSYWTHAGCIDTMAMSLRQQFVRLYKEDVLQMLYESVKLRLPVQAQGLPPPPAKGELDIEQVLNSRYFFH